MVLEKYYYDVLGVEVTANDLELKRAYRRQVVLHHPDKNPDDPAAGERFQLITEAYQVLGDPIQRKIYDEAGRDGVHVNNFDATALFKRIFGGGSFAPWVGELSLLKNIIQQNETKAKLRKEKDVRLEELANSSPRIEKNLADEPPIGSSHRGRQDPEKFARWKNQERNRIINECKQKEMEELVRFKEDTATEKRSRILSLADHLIMRLDSVSRSSTHESIDKFKQSLILERDALKLESFGIPLLQLIAQIYRSRATAFLGSSSYYGIRTIYYVTRDLWQVITNKISTFMAVHESHVAVALIKRDPVDQQGGGQESNSPSHERPISQEMNNLIAGKMINLAWECTKLELHGILRNVCDEVFFNRSSDFELLSQRALNLIKIADIFAEAQKDQSDIGIDGFFEKLVTDASKVKARDIAKNVG